MEKRSIKEQIDESVIQAKKRSNKTGGVDYLSARESRQISRFNRRITAQIERERNRRNVDRSEYITKMRDPNNVVEFDDLHTYFFTDVGTVRAVDGVSFDVPVGKTVGVVGESGCGKSVTSLSLMQLVQRPQGQIVDGAIRLNLGDEAIDIAYRCFTQPGVDNVVAIEPTYGMYRVCADINDVNDTFVLTNYWFIWIPAGVLLLATVLAFNIVGDGLRDAFDPKMKR